MAAAALVAFSANAQLNYTVQTACHPDDVKNYDTERLRASFLMEKVMSPDDINLTYTLYDRLIYGGVMPVNKVLVLETFDELKAEHFLDRRELGVINVGGDGVVTVDGSYDIQGRTLCRMRKEGSHFQKRRSGQPCKVLYQLNSSLQGVRDSAYHNRQERRS